MSKTIERLRYPGSGSRVRVSPFCLPIFADVSNFTRNFYPFPRGKPWSTRKRQTGTGVFCLLFLGCLNSTNVHHLTQINNAHMHGQSFQQFMANLNSESCHSLIGFLMPECLGFLKLQVIPRFTGTGTCISPVPVNRNRGILTSLISHSFAALTREILFLPLEHKIHISSQPSNILYLFKLKPGSNGTQVVASFNSNKEGRKKEMNNLATQQHKQRRK